MSTIKNYGIWMDKHTATVVGKESDDNALPQIIAHVTGEESSHNSSEKNANNHERTILHKFFNKITAHMQNATHLHVTGIGTAQEQFMHFLSDTPQFKNVKTEESTSNKMSDEKLLEFLATKI